MKSRHILLVAGVIAIATGQTNTKAVVVNLATANWTHEKGSPDGSEGAMVHGDSANGGIDLLVRFPAGHVIAPRR